MGLHHPIDKGMIDGNGGALPRSVMEGVTSMRRFLVWVALVASIVFYGSPALATDPDWITQVFPERTHEFGIVARGSQVRYTFPVINRTDMEVRIVDWKPKCGCTDVRVGSKVIPPGTQTTVEATIDTTRFSGPKASGLTLFLDRPVVTAVDLNMNCVIRADITLTPGFVDFGVVRPTQRAASANLTLIYAGGRPGWEIADMKTQSSSVKVVAKELGRTADGRIQWHLAATLEPGLPNGFFRDEVSIITNDSPPQTIPISVVANVQGAVSVTPSIINFGPLKPGQSANKLVRVRSSSPFAITKLSGSQPSLTAAEEKPASSAEHTVNITLKAPSDLSGPFHAVLEVESDLKDEPPAKIKAFATIVSSQ
jgi:Protein of unknown function (DUF1573)